MSHTAMPPLGQKTTDSSLPVVIASNQSAIPVTVQDTVTVTGGGGGSTATNYSLETGGNLATVVTNTNTTNTKLTTIVDNTTAIGTNTSAAVTKLTSLVDVDTVTRDKVTSVDAKLPTGLTVSGNSLRVVEDNSANISTAIGGLLTATQTVGTNTGQSATTLSAISGKVPTGLTVSGANLQVVDPNTGSIATSVSGLLTVTQDVRTNTSSTSTSVATVATNTGLTNTTLNGIATSNTTIVTNTTDASSKLATIVTNTGNTNTSLAGIKADSGTISTSVVATNTKLDSVITQVTNSATDISSIKQSNTSIDAKLPTGLTVTGGSLVVTDPGVGNTGFSTTTNTQQSAINTAYNTGSTVNTTGVTATTTLTGSAIAMSYTFTHGATNNCYLTYDQLDISGISLIGNQFILIPPNSTVSGTIGLHPDTVSIKHSLYSEGTTTVTTSPQITFTSTTLVSATVRSNVTKNGGVKVAVSEDLTATTIPFTISGGFSTAPTGYVMLQNQPVKAFVKGGVYGITGITMYASNNSDSVGNGWGVGAFLGVAPRCGANAISNVITSDITGLNTPNEIVLSPDGTNLYCTSSSGNLIYMYSRDTTTGALTPLQTPTVATGTTPSKMAISSDGNWLYVCNTGSSTLGCYARNVNTGILTSKQTTTITTAPTGLVISPDGRHLYCISGNTPYYYQYSINQTTGVLTIIGGQNTVNASFKNLDIIITPNGMDINFLHDGPGLMNASRNPFTGVLTLRGNGGGYASYTGVSNFIHSPTGGEIYTPLSTSSKLYIHTYTTGYGYTGGSRYVDGSSNLYGASTYGSCAVSPDGSVLWLAGSTAATLIGYDRSNVNGFIYGCGADRYANLGVTIGQIKITPDGNNIYFVNKTNNAIGRVCINNGMLPLSSILTSGGNYARNMGVGETVALMNRTFAKPVRIKPMSEYLQLHGYFGQIVTVQGTLEVVRLS